MPDDSKNTASWQRSPQRLGAGVLIPLVVLGSLLVLAGISWVRDPRPTHTPTPDIGAGPLASAPDLGEPAPDLAPLPLDLAPLPPDLADDKRARELARLERLEVERRLFEAMVQASRERRTPQARPGPAATPRGIEVRGALAQGVIQNIVRRHLNEVRFCYERVLRQTPDLEGRVMIQFTISSSGQVFAAAVQSSTLRSPPVEQCLTGAIRRWVFPRPASGIVIVSYPFVFKDAM